jgi:hypothetical protein
MNIYFYNNNKTKPDFFFVNQPDFFGAKFPASQIFSHMDFLCINFSSLISFFLCNSLILYRFMLYSTTINVFLNAKLIIFKNSMAHNLIQK